MGKLNSPTLRSIAVLRMEGYSNDEIASRNDCSISTVERKLRLIRREWSSAMEDRDR